MVDNNSDDPFAPRDGTIMRPRPGAGRRSAPETAVGPGAAPQGPRYSAPNAPLQAFSGSSAALSDFIVGARNPIIQSAAPLLTLASRLGTSVQQANIGTLRQQAVAEIRAFEDRLRTAGVSPEDTLVARYVLCTFVDAAVLNTPWGAQGDWASQSLLVMFHKEVSGGEKFFEILERLRTDPSRYIDLIELVYVCLALGYEGKYRHDPSGQARLGQLQHDLYRLIREQRQMRDEDLSPHWKGVEDRRNPIIRYVPWWIVAAAGLAILTGSFVFFHAKLASQAEPIKAALAGPAMTVDYPAPAPAQHLSRLKELLAPEEAAGKLTVEEFGSKTVVTLTAPNLFRSGSAQVNPDQYQTLRAVALALNQVPGHVVIVGHTDDQPVHSLRFADNFDLSRERAVAVAQVLKPALASFGRVEWQGAGSTQPRYRPVDTVENRARNRRVEIIHVPQPEAR
ncbi:MAG: type IVB secretion system protein IcmH/DotU [Steroidobacteraceae bacterium]